MTQATIELPEKLEPIFLGKADVRGAYGGRGSGKTRTFAKMTAVRAYMWSQAGREGQILCTRQFMNSLADSSLEEVKAAIRSEPWLAAHFEIGEKFIRTNCKRIKYTFAGLDRNIDSIKGQARILLNWTDEAEPVTDEAWTKLIPTLREEDSECWVTWNPESKRSETHKRFRLAKDPLYKVAEINWRDNPWFPEVLDRQRQRDKVNLPDKYGHIWEGEFLRVFEGAYYAKHLTIARNEGRVTHVGLDPLLQTYAFWDIGVKDATAIWIAQFEGDRIRVVDYYEVVGQPLAAHVHWLRDNGYGNATCVLPHDAAQRDPTTATRFEDHVRAAGFEVHTIPNQGKGAAMKRVEVTRRLFNRIWIDETKCESGLEALSWYHEKRDDKRDVGLGPEHDWASHGADAFGLMCVAAQKPEADIQHEHGNHHGRDGTTGY